MTDALDVEEFRAGYLAETEEHLSTARTCVLAIDAALQKRETHPRAVRDLFRALHTVKGLSAMVGAEPIVDVSHELETLLRSADRAGGALAARAIDEILRGIAFIEDSLRRMAKKEPLTAAPRALIEAIASVQAQPPRSREEGDLTLEPELLAKLTQMERDQILRGLGKGLRALRVDFVPSAARAQVGVNITSVREKMTKVAEIVKVLPRSIRTADGASAGVAFVLLLLTDASNETIAAVASTTPSEVQPFAARGEATGTTETTETTELQGGEDDRIAEDEPVDDRRDVVRVEVSRLDDALECLSALVINRSRLEAAVAEVPGDRRDLRELHGIIAQQGRQLRDLRAAIMRARMVPVAEVLERAPLLVRGLSRSSGKRVTLEVEAGRSELDKSVADRLFPAIVHLLRNAVDHALETPDERRARGKPEDGMIRLSCVERSGHQLALVVEDDGRGIDRSAVARRAGLPPPENDAELFAMIARPGLSTLDKATHVSGRGLGMDIVKRIVVDQLGGRVSLASTPGVGTRFTMLVPLSLTILDVFSFLCGDRRFVVPVNTVDSLAEVDAEHLSIAPDPRAKGDSLRMLRRGGDVLPLYTLRTLLGLPVSSALGKTKPKAIIVRRDADVFAFEVDNMLGQKEVVVRPVNDPLVAVDGVSGTTDLGDGRPTLVLDLLALARSADLQRRKVEV